MTRAKAGFDKYVQTRMGDREFASACREARAEIDAVDSLMRQLDDARKRARLILRAVQALPKSRSGGSSPPGGLTQRSRRSSVSLEPLVCESSSPRSTPDPRTLRRRPRFKSGCSRLPALEFLAGTAWAGSSAGCRRKKWTRHGCLGSAPAARLDRFPVMAWKIVFDDRTQATPSGRGLRLVPLPRTLGTEDLHGRRRSRRRTSGPSGRRPPRRW